LNLRRTALGLLVAGALGTRAPAAHANGRYPKADQLLLSRDQPGLLAVRSTFGLVLSRDAGQTWDWVCERAIGYSGIQNPTLGLFSSGTLILGLSEGLARSADSGCDWRFAEAPLGGSPIADLTVAQAAPGTALALVWDAQSVGYSSRLLRSSDDGQTFSAYGEPLDPSVLALTLDVAPSDAHRVYASGTRTVGGVRTASLFVSTDDAEHWTERAVPFDPKVEQGVYIAAVDPTSADTLYLRTNSASTSRLLVSRDAGRHFEVAYSGSLLAFALSPDGSRLYFGGEDGLHTGLASDLQFEQRGAVRLLCLAATNDTVYACSDERNGFTVGASTDGGTSFVPLLHLKTVRGPLACDGAASVASCQADWPAVRTQLGIPTPDASDAGASDAGATDASASPNASPPPHSSCAVSSRTPPPEEQSSAWGGALLAFALSRRCRSRQQRRLRSK
jgi:photosystem II stability/assembly factor-like uncharacterized protein